jgi:hypothetical protein
VNDDLAELGFAFTAFESGAKLGYAGVMIVLVEPDEASGFAPARIILRCVDASGDVRDTEVSADWRSDPVLRVAPGFITVQSHGAGELEIYCFGGELACDNDGKRTICHLKSAAPIFNLSEEGFDSDQNAVLSVVDNLEGEFAEQRARYTDTEEMIFARRLANTDPRSLVAVGLVLARQSFKDVPEALRTEDYWDEYRELTRALEEAEQAGWWPPNPTLDAVLAPAPATRLPGESL